MDKRIETLEELNEHLGEPRFDMNRYWAKTDMELLAWKLLAHIPFDIDILLKGTRAKDDTPMRLPDDYKEQQWEQYGELFTADNQPLRDWLTSTKLEHVAAYTLYLVRRSEIDKVSNYYDAAQDYYADYWYKFDDYTRGELGGHDFVVSFYALVDEVNNHIAEGKAMGLSMDEIVLHDCLWGLLPRCFDPDLVPIARETLQEAFKRLPAKPYIWSELGKRNYAPAMLKYTAERLEKAGYDIGYPEDYSIEQGYLLDYFSRLFWREADAKPED